MQGNIDIPVSKKTTGFLSDQKDGIRPVGAREFADAVQLR
jgi:hypothetical protein